MSSYADVLDSMQIIDKIDEIYMNNKKSIDKSVISQKSKELSSLKPLEICKLIVNKLHKYLSNDIGAKDFIKRSFNDPESRDYYKKYNWTREIINVNGYSCILVTDKYNKFIECDLPISEEASTTFDLRRIAIILAK